MRPIRCRTNLACLVATVALLTATAVRADGQQDVLDRFLITELQSRYALAHDLTDPALYAAVFTEDAELIGAGRLLAKGREALHAIGVNDRKRFNADATEGQRSFGALRHVITNSVVTLDGATAATGVCYVMTVVNRPEHGPEILSVGRYEDEYRKVDGAWLIAKRTIVMDMGNSELAKATGLFGE